MKHTEKLVIILPVRNEAAFIGKTIQSLIDQTHRPAEALFVDDGSTDQTAQLIQEAAREHDFIRYVYKPDRGVRSVGPGVVETFYFGMQHLATSDYTFLCKMDGDVELKPVYFENLIGKFKADPLLGAASGKLFNDTGTHLAEERMIDEMVAGPVNCYRRSCFESIGGFVREVMWDGIAFHMARMNGYRTRSFRDPDLAITHLRLMGSSHQSVFHGRMRWGRGQYFMGTHWLYALGISVYRMAERPFFIGGLGIGLGYVKAWFTRHHRFDYPGFRRSLRAWQLERLGIGKRLEAVA